MLLDKEACHWGQPGGRHKHSAWMTARDPALLDSPVSTQVGVLGRWLRFLPGTKCSSAGSCALTPELGCLSLHDCQSRPGPARPVSSWLSLSPGGTVPRQGMLLLLCEEGSARMGEWLQQEACSREHSESGPGQTADNQGFWAWGRETPAVVVPHKARLHVECFWVSPTAPNGAGPRALVCWAHQAGAHGKEPTRPTPWLLNWLYFSA